MSALVIFSFAAVVAYGLKKLFDLMLAVDVVQIWKDLKTSYCERQRREQSKVGIIKS